MIYLTGDTHADFSRFSSNSFPEQKQLTRADTIIILGDFGGVWDNSKRENYWLDWLAAKPFTLMFLGGNHENYDLLATYPIVPLCGGYARKIRDNVFMLLNGYVFTIDGLKFFVFGGAASHDVDGGIFEPDDAAGIKLAKYKFDNFIGPAYRINHISWWKEEIPSQEDMDRGLQSLLDNNLSVDYVLTHCLPTPILSAAFHFSLEINPLVRYFNDIYSQFSYKHWYCGHYHIDDWDIMGKYHICYEKIYALDSCGRFSSID